MVRTRTRAPVARPLPPRDAGRVRRAPPLPDSPRRHRRARAVVAALDPAGRRMLRVQQSVVMDSDSDDADVSIIELGSGRSSPGGGLDDSVEMNDSRLDMSRNEYMADSFVVADDDNEESSDDDDDNLSYESGGGEAQGVNMDESVVSMGQNDDDLSDDSDIESASSADSSVADDLNGTMPDDVIRSAEHGHCSICFEDNPYDPMGCIMCRQLIGCKRCVDKWYRTGQKKKERREENAENHFMCPLCRHPWEAQPEIDSIFLLE